MVAIRQGEMAMGRYKGQSTVHTLISSKKTAKKQDDDHERIDQGKGKQKTFIINRKREKLLHKHSATIRTELHRQERTADDKHCTYAISAASDLFVKQGRSWDWHGKGSIIAAMTRKGHIAKLRNGPWQINPSIGIPKESPLHPVFYLPPSPPAGQNPGPGFKFGIPKAVLYKFTPARKGDGCVRWWAILKRHSGFCLKKNGTKDKRFSNWIAVPAKHVYRVPDS
jgi:hypothetical protein